MKQEMKQRLIWVAKKDYDGRVVQIYACCSKHAKELLERNERKGAHPTFYTRISRREADRILRREMGYGAWAEGCDFCLVED
jgi:hypothetical protein